MPDIDAGGSVYSLQGMTPGGEFALVRSLHEADADRLMGVVDGLRRYYLDNPFHLVFQAERRLYEDLAAMAPGDAPAAVPGIGAVIESYVSWVLLFQLTLDQWASEIRSRHGASSPELAEFEAATRSAYDAHYGYRIAAAARDRIAHRRLPRISGQSSRRRTPQGGVETEASVAIERVWFDEWSRCPSLVKQYLSTLKGDRIELAPHIADAMDGVQSVRLVAEPLLYPELRDQVTVLRGIANESSPNLPAILRIEMPDGESPKLHFAPMHDVLLRLADSPPLPRFAESLDDNSLGRAKND